jgi:2-polyprenyl-3-methyl-5-hydroxy-6-metoxy-1,4-benzoquinol methylase
MFDRIPEPELMEDRDQCEFYNYEFDEDPDCLEEFIKTYDQYVGITSGTIIDLGSGTCNFIIKLCETYPDIHVTCYEASSEMIRIANRNIESNQLAGRITIVEDNFFNATGQFDVVIATRVLHHVNKTQEFWSLINRLSSRALICDLERPNELVDIQEDFPIDLKNSFMAAYTVTEVEEQVKGYNYTVLQKLHNDNLSSYTVFTNTNT